MEETEIHAIEVAGDEGEGGGDVGGSAGEFLGPAGKVEGVDANIRSARQFGWPALQRS